MMDSNLRHYYRLAVLRHRQSYLPAKNTEQAEIYNAVVLYGLSIAHPQTRDGSSMTWWGDALPALLGRYSLST